MLKIYGSMLCGDCVQCVKDLDAAGVSYTFLDFKDSLLNLKEFLSLRDSLSVFDEARESGFIGIPCILREDGTVTLNWAEYVSQADA